MLRYIFLVLSLLWTVIRCNAASFALSPSSFTVDPNGGSFAVRITDTSLPAGMLLTYGKISITNIIDSQGYLDRIDFPTPNNGTLYFKPRDKAVEINGSVSFTCTMTDIFTGEYVSCIITFTYRYPNYIINGGIIQVSDKYYKEGDYPDRIISIAPAVADGDITYTWEKKEVGDSWTVIPNEHGEEYRPEKMGYFNVEYRRKAEYKGVIAYSNSVVIKAALNAGTIGLEYEDESTTIRLVNKRSPSVPTTCVSWEKSEDLVTWTQCDQSKLSMTLTKPAKTTYYRRKVWSTNDSEYIRYSNVVCYSLTRPVYITTKTATDSLCNMYIENKTYFDGLGRSLQQVEVGAAKGGADLIQAYLYDLKGREAKTCLPFAVTNNAGEFVNNAEAKMDQYYASAYNTTGPTYPYTYNEYDGSPLNRIVRIFRPGSVYQDQMDHFSAYDYGTNSSEDQVLDLTINDRHYLCVNGYRKENSLSKTRITDDDGHIREEFTDGEGQTILVRSFLDDTTTADTYYVYDLAGRLRWAISPEGSARLQIDNKYSINDEFANLFCHRYEYDNQGRLAKKYIPGQSDCSDYFYDQYDRIIRTITPGMRARNLSLNHEYDTLGRLVRSYLQNQSIYHNTHISYYDNYVSSMSESDVHRFIPVDSIVSESDRLVNTAGLLTRDHISSAFDLGQGGGSTGLALTRTFYYDQRGRVIQTIESRSDGNILRTSNRYDYMGNLLVCAEQYQIGDKTYDIRYCYTYDSHGRRTHERILIDGEEITNAANSYDDMGRIERLSLDSMYTEFSYNMQGWLTQKKSSCIIPIIGIKQTIANVPEFVITRPDPWCKFEIKLRYYDSESATPSYTGNIVEIQEYQDSKDYTRTYTYDNLSRLISSSSSTSGRIINVSDEKNIVYDRNGNILSFDREIPFQKIYSYTREHDGNRLTHSTEIVTTKGFMGQDMVSDPVLTTFAYDVSGNIVAIQGAEDLEIRYNYLNLPKEIHLADTMALVFTYFADGTKHSVLDSSGNGYMYIGAVRFAVREYQAELESLPFAGGRIVKTSNGYEPRYYLTDHLGSTRMVMGPDGKTVDASFYYMAYGLEQTDADSPTSSTEFRFSGKEKLQALGDANIYDFGARLYLPEYGIWNAADPLSEKYYASTPYAYCAGNPIGNIDPDGMRVTEALNTYINQLMIAASKLEQRNKNQIQALQAKIEAGDLSEGAVRRINKKIARIKSDNREIADMRAEIDVLRKSNQLYDIAELNSTHDNYYAVTGYAEKTGAVTILLYSGSYNRNTAVAHELKHAYQFETGKLSFGNPTKDEGSSIGLVHFGGAYYDITDEENAFRRGAVFGGPASPDPEIYNQVNSKSYVQGVINEYAMPRLLALKEIFRLNGITYK